MSPSTATASTISRRTSSAHTTAAMWQAITAGLPADQVVSVVRADPKRPGLLFAGTENSVFVSFDDGDNWQPLQQNLPTRLGADLLGPWRRSSRRDPRPRNLGPWRPRIAASGHGHDRLRASASVRASRRIPGPVQQQQGHTARARTPVGRKSAARRNYRLLVGHCAEAASDARDQGIPRVRSSAASRALIGPRRFPPTGISPKSGPSPSRCSPQLRARIVGFGTCAPRVRKRSNIPTALRQCGRKDTPLLPEGQLVPPGRYSAVLTVDGKQQSRASTCFPIRG